MKFLVDSCISRFAVEALRSEKHEVYWVPEHGSDPGDLVIIRKAFSEGSVLVTADKDFGELVFLFDEPSPAIVRLVDIQARQQGTMLLSLVRRYKKELLEKALITAGEDKIRIRLHPKQ